MTGSSTRATRRSPRIFVWCWRQDDSWRAASFTRTPASRWPTPASNEFIPQVVGSAGGGAGKPIPDGKPAGDPAYYHAVVPVDVQTGDKEKEANITLRRGVTVKGRLVGPDEKPVPHAILFVSA